MLYKQREAIALQKAANGDFSNGENLVGDHPKRECFQLLYHPYFSGYFYYKLFNVLGDFREDRCTWWSFDAESAANECIADAYEQPLRLWEVKSWLDENYGHLMDPGDYEYLIAVLLDSGYHSRHSYDHALQWLTAQRTRVASLVTCKIEQLYSSPTVAHSSTNSVSLNINTNQSRLSPAERILGEGFSLEEADMLAWQVELVDEQGRYQLGPRKLSAIVGFCQALKESNRLVGTIPEITMVIGPRYGVDIRTRKSTSSTAKEYYTRTKTALRNLKTTI